MKSVFIVLVFNFLLAVFAGSKCRNIDFSEFDPCQFSMQLIFSGYGKCGVELKSVELAASQPLVKFNDADGNAKYILVMVDPDAPSANLPSKRFWRHWLLSDIRGSELLSGSMLTGSILTAYQGPMPPERSGLHRYQFYLFRQPSTFKHEFEVKGENWEAVGRGKWGLDEFVVEYNLCGLLAASYQYSASRN